MTNLSEIAYAATNLYDNRLGWADGISAHAPLSFWNDLAKALGRPPMAVSVDLSTETLRDIHYLDDVPKDRTERPDFGVLGKLAEPGEAEVSPAVNATLAQAGLDPADDAAGPVFVDADGKAWPTGPLPASPLLCATLDEVRRFAESQGKGRYAPESDRRTALDLIAALAGILDRPVPDQSPSDELEVRALEFDQRAREAWEAREARQSALQFAVQTASALGQFGVIKAADAFLDFLTASAPPGKVYATKADIDGLHERVDGLTPKTEEHITKLRPEPALVEWDKLEALFRATCARWGSARAGSDSADVKVGFSTPAEANAFMVALANMPMGMHPEPVADDGWVEWGGGSIPVSLHDTVDIKLRHSGVVMGVEASTLVWVHGTEYEDIVSYRLTPPAS